MTLTIADKVVGVRRAQRGAEAGMAAAIQVLASASVRGGELWVADEPLSSGRVRAAVQLAFAAANVGADEITVTHGPQSADPDSLGEGVIQSASPVVLDLYPRDRQSGLCGDLARTVAVDPPEELRLLHTVCVDVHEELRPLLRAGSTIGALWASAREVYGRAGVVAQGDARAGSIWFAPVLGHGVGVQAHELPLLAESSSDVLREGDVIAVEPAVYRAEFGGCRVENLYLIGAETCELLGGSPLALDVKDAAAAIGTSPA